MHLETARAPVRSMALPLGTPELACSPDVSDHTLQSVSDRFGFNSASEIAGFMRPGEELFGFGNGGSESLVMFLNFSGSVIVRKVCGEDLSSVNWDPSGTGVMAPPSTKAGYQVDYLLGLPDEVKPYFPGVQNVERVPFTTPSGVAGSRLVYDQNFIPGEEVSSFVAEHRPNPLTVARIHREIFKCLAEKVHSHRRVSNTENTIQESYIDKIKDRLELSYAASPELFGPLLSSDQIIINGVTYRGIDDLLAFFSKPEVQEMLEPKHHSLVMGDTNTENVKIGNPDVLLEAMKTGVNDFTYDDLGIRFLDPRSIGFRTVGRDTVDDPMYDNKPVHNTLGNYDAIHAEQFGISFAVNNGVPNVRIELDDTSPYVNCYNGMGEYLKDVLGGWCLKDQDGPYANDPNWLLRFSFVMGTHFAAMPPFHFSRDENGIVQEKPEMQKRAIAIFCQGIKWLNLAQKMITTEQQRLCGLQFGCPVESVRS